MTKDPQTQFIHKGFAGLIGVSQVDITPPKEIYFRNWGASKYDVADGIHRPLVLTCLTMKNTENGKPLFLMGADLGWWRNADDERAFRWAVLEALSIHPSQLMVCLSHTHAGPSMCRDDKEKEGGHLVAPYLKKLSEQAILAARQALKSVGPASITWQYGKCDLATNRDLPADDGDRMIVGYNPQLPADDTLLVGRVTDSDNDIIATIVNYACHPTTLAWDNRKISPDYIGAMRETINTSTKAPCIFLQGASGNLAPNEQYVGDLEVADKHGRQLGYAVLSTLEGMLPPCKDLSWSETIESGAPLAIWDRTPAKPNSSLKTKLIEVEYALKDLPTLAEIETDYRATEDPVLKERLWRKRGIRKSIGDGASVKVPLWIWQIGDSVLIGQPNEAYPELQVELRKRFPALAIGVMNIVNGSIGYLPPKDLYDKDIYTVWQTPFAKGSLEVLINRAVESIEEIAGVK